MYSVINGHHYFNRCQCGNCTSMDTADESVCCRELQRVLEKLEDQNLETQPECIILHPGYEAVCLNEWVLATAYSHYKQDHGPLINQPQHKWVPNSLCMDSIKQLSDYENNQPVYPCSESISKCSQIMSAIMDKSKNIVLVKLLHWHHSALYHTKQTWSVTCRQAVNCESCQATMTKHM